jgi:hypothetical protein
MKKHGTVPPYKKFIDRVTPGVAQNLCAYKGKIFDFYWRTRAKSSMKIFMA